MIETFKTMPGRVAISATLFSIAILGLGAVILVYIYKAHEVREMQSLLTQDIQIESQRFQISETGKISHEKTGSETLYDRFGSQWIWQLFEETQSGLSLVDQSDSLGPLEEDSKQLPFPPSDFSEFTTVDDMHLLGKMVDVKLPGGDTFYRFGIAAPVLHVSEEVEEATMIVGATFMGLGVLLSVLVYTVVSAGLRPLGRLRREIESMQHGQGTISNANWPVDLEPIVDEVRALDDRIAALIERHRRQASDLAHSLKTPLAVISRVVPDLPEADQSRIVEQTDRISDTVRRNLSRLRTGTPRAISTPVHDAVEEIVFALEVLFRERSLDIRNTIDASHVFLGDPDDLKEITGNLLDNACKWARSKVVVSSEEKDGRLTLIVSDDGIGISEDQLQRNSSGDNPPRDDEFVSGVGLLIVRDIAELYQGSLEIGTSSMGGAEIRVIFPAVSSK